jgi:hypothetical protein
MKPSEIRGWCAVGLSTLIACFWAFWGIIENFHEGWYARALWQNLALMLVQYLSFPLVFMTAAVVGIRFPRVGGTLHFAMAGFAIWFFGNAGRGVLLPTILAPLILIGALYWTSEFPHRQLAMRIALGLPLLTMILCGAEPAYRVSQRHDDGYRGARSISGNGVELTWAPAGPGWPNSGVSWFEAVRRCRYLSADGMSLATTPQNLWRLPTVDEAVRSMGLHGKNCGGTWNASAARAEYRQTPDKESPLWDLHSQVIYWWTATERSPQEALIIVYDGKVWPRRKTSHWGYLGFRAVRNRLPGAEQTPTARSIPG